MDAENTAEVSNEQTQVDANAFYGEADESSEVETASEEESTGTEESGGTIAGGDTVSEDSEESSEEEEAASKEPDDTKEEESLELELPEGSLLNAQQIEEVKQFAKENNLSNEVAQKILESNHSVAQNLVQQAQEKQAELQASWKEESIKELGGDLKEVQRHCKLALDKYADSDFQKLLLDTKYGDHVAVLKFLNKIGKEMAPDKMHSGSSQVEKEKAFHDKFYNVT